MIYYHLIFLIYIIILVLFKIIYISCFVFFQNNICLSGFGAIRRTNSAHCGLAQEKYDKCNYFCLPTCERKLKPDGSFCLLNLCVKGCACQYPYVRNYTSKHCIKESRCKPDLVTF